MNEKGYLVDNERIAKEIMKVAKELEAGFFHEKDTLMAGITFEDLITVMQSNYSIGNINKSTVKEAFKELYRKNYRDALSELNWNMDKIIELSK